MQKIDRLGWAAGVCFESYGLKIGVRVNQPAVPGQVLACLPPGWRPAEPPFVDHLFSFKIGGLGDRLGDGTEHGLAASPVGPGHGSGRPTRGTRPRPRVRQFHLLYGGRTQLARSMDANDAYEALEGNLQLLVAEQAKERVFVHAGVVAWKGRAIVLPGRSFSGKSTLTATLLKAGAAYYSDEYAVLDRHGRVHPYPRRLCLRQPDAKRPERRSAEELGTRTGVEPLPVGLVAIARYKPGSRWNPRPLTPGQAVLEMLNHTVPAQTRPDAVLSTLERIAPQARNLKGLRGEAEETAEQLLQELEH